ncbi:hypothetical protein CK203_047781 [Vitis vinifera]|uniref:Uncharacterized protein n=1 Tax=Vitis vinifera TaxID=29760 RepID=A0A438GY48_VITVI|nr:hypothetical protein CK203_047781 [Vitis vinifera]
MVKEQTHGEPAKVVEPCKVGEEGYRKKAQSSGTVSKIVTEVDGTKGGQHSVWGRSSCFEPRKNLLLGRQRESGWTRGPAVEGQVLKVFKDLEEMGWPMMGRPNLENLKRVRASDGSLYVDGEQEGDLFGSQLRSLPPAVNLSKITDEALLEAASRYSDQIPHSLFSLGKWEISLSSTPSGWDEEGVAIARVSDQGRGSEAVGGAVMRPLRMILADGREAEVSDLAEKESGTVEEVSEGVSERVSQEDEEERVEEGELC